MLVPTPALDRILASVSPFVMQQPGALGHQTALPRMTVWSSAHVTPPTPGILPAQFYVVVQGVKVATVGGNRYVLRSGDCAASAFGVPYVGELTEATPMAPFVALSLELNANILADVMLDTPRSEGPCSCSTVGGRLDGSLGDVLARYVGLLDDAEDQKVLATAYERELYYRLLKGPMAATLRQIGRLDDRTQRIKTAADWLGSHHDKPVVMTELAASVGMSLTSFHRHFKALTGHSPLAFQRHLRLLEAKRLLAAGNLSVAKVAYAIGYVSASQFSREYKSMFGTPPVVDHGSPDRVAAV